MPLQATSGAATYDAYGGGVAAGPATYIEDVFSTYLYTGTNTVQGINNGIQIGNGYVGGGTGGSGSFDGVNDYLSVPTGTALDLTGDFTIEAWVYQTAAPVYYGIFGSGDYPTTAQVTFTVSYGNPQLYMANGTGWGVGLVSTAAIPNFSWTHIAATCSGSTFTIWVNGVNSGSTTYSGARVSPGATAVLGRLYPGTNDYYFAGNMSNLRVVKGTALYTTNFTPPTSALTAVSGTQLLCLQGSTPFVDNSTNALTITNNNGTAVSSLGPFPFTSVTGNGGLVWTKPRSASGRHCLFDTNRGATKYIISSSTSAEITASDTLTSFNSNGFTLGADAGGIINTSGTTYASWTFRKQAKFFDVVTYAGDGNSFRNISHSLGSVPGMIIVKELGAANGWAVYHRTLSDGSALQLQSTGSAAPTDFFGPNSAQTSTTFQTGNNNLTYTNGSGKTYVAYLFAHDAGGFGLSGNDNVISCGSFTTDSGGVGSVVNLGYEPQFILFKASNAVADWRIVDNMRGMSVDGQNDAFLRPNSIIAETNSNEVAITSTGFSISGVANGTYIYMAIRRGPMKTPTSATSVFQPVRYAGDNASSKTISTGKTFPTDWLLTFDTENGASGTGTSYNSPDITRLTGFGVNPPYLRTNSTNAEVASVERITLNNSNFDYTVSATSGQLNSPGANYTNWNFGRAPGFFDVVCYTGTGTQTAFNHNLGVAPELLIVKRRDAVSTQGWATGTNFTSTAFLNLLLNTTDAGTTNNYADVTLWKAAPTSTTFTVGSFAGVNASGGTYVAYLFATVAGVSKVGSYTGTGSTQTISAGLPTGARFVLIKRTDSTGDWWAWDTATGMVAGNDTRIAINQTAQIINQNWVYTVANGFQIVTTDAAVNASGGSYIYLAIA